MDSFELLEILKSHFTPKYPFWWEEAGSFDVVIGAILVQRTKWENAQKGLQNLKKHNKAMLEELAFLDEIILQNHIKECGFYTQKAKNLKLFCQNVLEDFGDFDEFSKCITREWLLFQKGIGFESADAILNYACKKEVFVVDSYLHRILTHLGFCFDEYNQMQDWIISGLDDRFYNLYSSSVSKAQIYARFHGKIVMFGKAHLKGKRLSDDGKVILGI